MITIEDTLEISYYLTSKGYRYINNIDGMSVYFHKKYGYINVSPEGLLSVYLLTELHDLKSYLQLVNLSELICKGS
jgi:hypothetical protein